MIESPFRSEGLRSLIDVYGVSKSFPLAPSWTWRFDGARYGRSLRAVDEVSFQLYPGETLGIVGESGCGKSTLARLLVGLDRPSAGKVLFDGVDINATRSRREAARLRRNWQMIFQDPYTSLNPRWRVRDIVAEPIRAFRLATSRSAVTGRVAELLQQVGLSARDGDRFPHEFSGGQRQRISVARALASKPRCIVCDEPTSALDVSMQAQILNLMKDLQQSHHLGYVFISHDLAVIHHMADRVGVMYLGRLCELAPAQDLFDNPQHPYTRSLLDAMPSLHPSRSKRKLLPGEPPDPTAIPSGCGFHPRCPLADDRCRAARPETILSKSASVACHAVAEGRIKLGWRD